MNLNKNRMSFTKKLIIELFLISFSSLPLTAQSFTIDKNSIGLLENDSIIIGSGFILDSSNQVITCAHVILNQVKVYFSTDGNRYELEVRKIDLINDIAYLKSASTICETPFKKAFVPVIENGETIVYLGYDWVDTKQNNQNIIKVHQSKITAYGKQSNDEGNANFIEFIGEGKPGYSGGPVLNWKGEILGLMREAWFRKDLKVGHQTLVNRAFLIN